MKDLESTSQVCGSGVLRLVLNNVLRMLDNLWLMPFTRMQPKTPENTSHWHKNETNAKKFHFGESDAYAAKLKATQCKASLWLSQKSLYISVLYNKIVKKWVIMRAMLLELFSCFSGAKQQHRIPGSFRGCTRSSIKQLESSWDVSGEVQICITVKQIPDKGATRQYWIYAVELCTKEIQTSTPKACMIWPDS